MKTQEAFKFDSDQRSAMAEALSTAIIKNFIAVTKAAEDSGTFEVVISTATKDRQGDIVDQDGLMLDAYMKNPVVLWAHDYFSLPIGICDSISKKGGKTIAKGRFAPMEANPFAQQVRKMYDAGFLKATSVGFIPHEADGESITKAELLEFSFVPVPANAEALSMRSAKEYKLNVPLLVSKGLNFTDDMNQKAVVPFKSHGTAPEATAWDAGKEVKAAGDDLDKLKAMCAWYDAENPDVKSSYKFPHHQADGLKAVWNGVKAAMGALHGARGGAKIPEGDRKGIYDHLAKHYKEFDQEPPDFKDLEKATRPGDPCTMDDGTAGVFADNDGDPDEPLVCVPDKDSMKNQNNKNKPGGEEEPNSEAVEQEIRDRLKAEHDRHVDAIHDAIEEYKEAAAAADEEEGDHEDGHDEPDEDDEPGHGEDDGDVDDDHTAALHEKLDAEHEMHFKNITEIMDAYKGIAVNRSVKGIDEFREKAIEVFKAIEEAHGMHGKAHDGIHKAIEIFKELAEAHDDGDGEDGKPPKKAAAAPKKRSSPTELDVNADEVKLASFGREILREVFGSVTDGLSRYNEKMKGLRADYKPKK